MKMEMNNLWGDTMPYALEGDDFIPVIKAYPGKSKGAVVVFPGGAYEMRATHEGDGLGEWFQKNGITAFVVEYRVSPNRHPAELSDAMRAVKYVRIYADKYGIDKDKIAVMGFSAGGHLAGSVSVHYDKDIYEPTDEIDKESTKPNASILCYPVIDMGEYRHDGSRKNLIGSEPDEKLIDYFSLQKHVTEDTPGAFIWHTSTDNGVSVMNSVLYARALSEKRIPYEMHIYPVGDHGLGLSENLPYVSKWSRDLLEWLKMRGWN